MFRAKAIALSRVELHKPPAQLEAPHPSSPQRLPHIDSHAPVVFVIEKASEDLV
jgi:hypothetical protein